MWAVVHIRPIFGFAECKNNSLASTAFCHIVSAAVYTCHIVYPLHLSLPLLILLCVNVRISVGVFRIVSKVSK